MSGELPAFLPVELNTNQTEYQMNKIAAKYNATNSLNHRGSLFAQYKKLREKNLWE